MELYFLALLVLLMAVALGSGYPVAFALPGSAIITIGLAAGAGYLFAGDPAAYFAQGGPGQWLSAGVTNFRGIYWEAERDTLIAIPLFVFMGIMLQRSKIAEDLLVTMAQLFGPVPGGLGISVIFVGALLAATTGIVGATVVAMGLISLPAMMRSNYSNALASGTIAASGTLGQIIPPSIVLIILADQLSSAVDQASTARKLLYKASTGELSMPSAFDVTSTSAGEMFLGAFIPGLVLVGLYMAFVLIVALIRPKLAPAVEFDGKFDRHFATKLFLALVPPLALIFVVLGSIIMGIATVNQAGAIGAVGATIMAGYRLREGHSRAYIPAILAIISLVGIFVVAANYSLNVKNIKTTDDAIGIALGVISVIGFLIAVAWSGWRTLKIEDTLRGVMVETAKTTSLVFIILLGAAMLTAAFRAFGGEDLVREFLTSMPGGFWAQFVIVMAVIFFLGFFLDFIEIAVVVVPIVAPILLMDPGANVTAVWLGVMIGLNIQTSFLTPPFGFALFYLRGVAPAVVKTVQIYKGVIAFIGLQIVALCIVGLNPELVNYLPNRVSLTSDTAPPPLNPRLQYCVEENVFAKYNEHGEEIRGSIASVRGLDTSFLPKKLAKELAGGLDKADDVFDLVADIRKAEAAIEAATPGYAPLHRQVREVHGAIRKIDLEVKELEAYIGRAKRHNGTGIEAKEARVAILMKEREVLEAEIPSNWDADHKVFAALQKTENKARALYRRTADGAYGPVREVADVLAGTDALLALDGELVALKDVILNAPGKEAADKISDTSKIFGDIEGTSKVRSALSKARRFVKSRKPKPEEAIKEIDKARTAFLADLEWRKRAVTELKPAIDAYEAMIHDTIGLRQQKRLPRAQALDVAGCLSHHRDLSLNF